MIESGTALPPIDGAYFSAWTVAWAPDALIAAATIAFLAGLWRQDRQRPRRLLRRLACWAAAAAALVVAFNSSVGIYSDALFVVHMAQHLLLIMVVPPLLVWSEPWSLIPVRGDRSRTFADVLDDSKVWRAATSPLLAVALYTAIVVLTHLTSFQELAVGRAPVRVAENVAYLVVGYLLFARLVEVHDRKHSLPDLIRFVVLAAAMGGDTLTGVSLMMTGHVLAPAYSASHPGWGPGALMDQTAAGALMWVAGDSLMMILMIVVGVLWGMRHSDAGLGPWLEEIRRRELLGDRPADTDAASANVDVDQAALDAYNSYLAELGRHDAHGA